MNSTVAKMTKEELKELIETVIEQKLLELFGDPDEDLEIRESLKERLLRQKKEVLSGNRGKSFDDVIEKLSSE